MTRTRAREAAVRLIYAQAASGLEHVRQVRSAMEEIGNGVHPGTRIPKGTLADPALRKKRMLAHHVFDQIWQRGILSRADAYRWMADKFCLSDAQAHIGQFGSYMCDQVILESRKLLANHCLQAAG